MPAFETLAEMCEFPGVLKAYIDIPSIDPNYLLFSLDHSVHGEPVGEGIEPTGAGCFFGVHTKAVAALLVVVKLNRSIGGAPTLD